MQVPATYHQTQLPDPAWPTSSYVQAQQQLEQHQHVEHVAQLEENLNGPAEDYHTSYRKHEQQQYERDVQKRRCGKEVHQERYGNDVWQQQQQQDYQQL